MPAVAQLAILAIFLDNAAIYKIMKRRSRCSAAYA